MGRGRGKTKKQIVVVTNHNDAANMKEEKVLVSKRRGRPQRSLSKDEVEDEAIEKIANGEESAKSSIKSKSSKDQSVVENGTKRKISTQVKENSDSVKVENGLKANFSAEISVKSVGFRHIGSRRKGKPCRAAEVGVKCK